MTHYEKRQVLKQLEESKANLKESDLCAALCHGIGVVLGTLFIAMTGVWLISGNVFSLESILAYLSSTSLFGIGTIVSAIAIKQINKDAKKEQVKIDYLNDKLDEDAKQRDRQEVKQRILAKQPEILTNSNVQHSVQTNDMNLLDYDVDSIFDENGFFRNLGTDANCLGYVGEDIQKEKPKTLSLGKKITRR